MTALDAAGAAAAARAPGGRHRAHSRRLLPPGRRRRCRACSSSCTAATRTGRASSRAMCRASSAPGRRGWPPQGRRERSSARERADAPVVQRGQRQQLLSGAGAGGAGHDADRRAADGDGHGARMGARHARSRCWSRRCAATRSCSARRCRTSCSRWSASCSACCPPSSCSTCRCAARSGVLFGASMLYVLVALGIGLLISSWVKNQLVASQLTMLATFMPAFMLSGFLFDLRSMPTAVRVDHLRAAGALLRGAAAERIPGRRRLVGDRAEHAGARAHGGRCWRSPAALVMHKTPGMNAMLGALAAHSGPDAQGAARGAQGSAQPHEPAAFRRWCRR